MRQLLPYGMCGIKVKACEEAGIELPRPSHHSGNGAARGWVCSFFTREYALYPGLIRVTYLRESTLLRAAHRGEIHWEAVGKDPKGRFGIWFYHDGSVPDPKSSPKDWEEYTERLRLVAGLGWWYQAKPVSAKYSLEDLMGIKDS